MKSMLIKLPGVALSNTDIQRQLQGLLPEPCAIEVYQATQFKETYLYLHFKNAEDTDHAPELKQLFIAHCPNVEVIRLRQTLNLAGHSADQKAAWHYIVETDVQPEAEDDFNDWYLSEHMPGLAAVPGTIRARRYISDDTSPKYYAAYDLETLETFGSLPWLAVRATDWSSRVRPSFVNTKRTMFKKVASTCDLKPESCQS